MFTDEQRKEFRDDGLTEDEINLLENSLALADTIEMLPKDMDAFLAEYKSKIPEDTINGMKAIAYAAEHDQKFFKELMALGFVLNFAEGSTSKPREVKTLDNLSDEEYNRAKERFFSTFEGLSDKEKLEFINMIVNITPEQKEDMLDRLKR